MSQSEWDVVRFEILAEAAKFTEKAGSHPALFTMLSALTRAFDRPVPVYSVYRQLRSFKAGQWPLLRNLIANTDNQALTDRSSLDNVLVRVATLLEVADKNRDQLTEALEIELEVLKTLIDELDQKRK